MTLGQGFRLGIMSRIALPAYLGSSATSLLGNSAFGVVLPWLVLERTGDPAATGLVAAITAIPGIPAAFFGGYLIDKIGRRRMAIFADFCSAAAVAALPIVDALFGLDLGWFILLGLLSAVFDVPGAAAREALLGNVSEASDVSLDRLAAIATVFMKVNDAVEPTGDVSPLAGLRYIRGGPRAAAATARRLCDRRLGGTTNEPPSPRTLQCNGRRGLSD